MEPYNYKDADVYLATTIDNLYDMSQGRTSFDKLYVNGQLKVEGNISKAAELRNLLFQLRGE